VSRLIRNLISRAAIGTGIITIMGAVAGGTKKIGAIGSTVLYVVPGAYKMPCPRYTYDYVKAVFRLIKSHAFTTGISQLPHNSGCDFRARHKIRTHRSPDLYSLVFLQ